MAVSLKHAFNCAKADGVDATAVKPSDWNAEHQLTAAAGKVLGTPVGSTTVSELPIEVDTTGQSIKLPSGTTAQRPASPSAGMLRYNTSNSRLEGYVGSAWLAADNPVRVSGTSPSNPYTGDIWFDTDDNSLYVHNGTAFVAPSTTTADGSITLAKLAAAVQQSLVPSGSLMPFAGASAPTGWLLCYGQAVSRTTYAALFTAIGTTYGAGDGSTTFTLPDLRGRVIAGQDDMGGTSANRLTDQSGGLNGDTLGATGGAETHTLTTTEMPSHNHLTGIGDSGTSALFIYGTSTTGTPGLATDNISNGTNTPDRQGLTSSTGGGAAHNNVQPTIILNYIIKT